MFLVAGLATCGLPGLSPFVSEMLVIIAAFDHAWWAGAVAVTAIVLAAIYVLWMYQRTMTGPGGDVGSVEVMRDLDAREVGTLAPLLLALVLFGFFPMPLLDVINPHVTDVMTNVGVTDAPPTTSGRSARREATRDRLREAHHRVLRAVRRCWSSSVSPAWVSSSRRSRRARPATSRRCCCPWPAWSPRWSASC